MFIYKINAFFANASIFTSAEEKNYAFVYVVSV